MAKAGKNYRAAAEFEPVPVGESAAAPEGQTGEVAVVVWRQILGCSAAFVSAFLVPAPVPAGPAFARRKWLRLFTGPRGWWPRLRRESDFPGAWIPTGWQPV